MRGLQVVVSPFCNSYAYDDNNWQLYVLNQELIHLDLSDDPMDGPDQASVDLLSPAAKFKISVLLQKTESLPKLHSLDISGEFIY